MTAPSKFAHVVYNTHRYQEMIDWYGTVFEARIRHGDDRLTFMTYDDEHHRFAFFNLGAPADEHPKRRLGRGVGVHHVAYTWANLDELLALYRRLRDAGITPETPIKHGMTLSMYYADPDGNLMEFQVDLMSPDDSNEFMRTAAFEANPVGEPFDPDELLAAHEAGEPLDALIFRSDQEPAATPGG